METYKVGDKEHNVYSVEETPIHIKYIDNWRDGEEGDWVKTDDDHVMQILRRKKIGKTWSIGTCTGTYLVSDSTTMDSVRKKDIYSVSGENWYTRLKNRKKCTKKELAFAMLLKQGKGLTESYLAVFDTNDRDQAKKKAAILFTTERMQKVMNEKLETTFGKLSVNLDYLIEAAKNIVDGGKNDSDRLKALSMLWDAYGVVEKQKVTEVRGVFQGFAPEQIQSAGRALLEEGKEDVEE